MHGITLQACDSPADSGLHRGRSWSYACPDSKPFRTRESAITLPGTAQRTNVKAERFTQTELLRLKSNHAEPNQLRDGAGRTQLVL
jgi:hypothetical protein